MINLEALRKPLQAHEIDFRIQSINKGGYATILAYKDARADMNDRLANGEMPEDICEEWFGLEPDYIFELIG